MIRRNYTFVPTGEEDADPFLADSIFASDRLLALPSLLPHALDV